MSKIIDKDNLPVRPKLVEKNKCAGAVVLTPASSELCAWDIPEAQFGVKQTELWGSQGVTINILGLAASSALRPTLDGLYADEDCDVDVSDIFPDLVEGRLTCELSAPEADDFKKLNARFKGCLITDVAEDGHVFNQVGVWEAISKLASILRWDVSMRRMVLKLSTGQPLATWNRMTRSWKFHQEPCHVELLYWKG